MMRIVKFCVLLACLWWYNIHAKYSIAEVILKMVLYRSDSYYNRVNFSYSLTSQVNGSLLVCALECIKHRYCLSMFYNLNKSMCNLNSVVYSSTAGMANEVGWQYYVSYGEIFSYQSHILVLLRFHILKIVHYLTTYFNNLQCSSNEKVYFCLQGRPCLDVCLEDFLYDTAPRCWQMSGFDTKTDSWHFIHQTICPTLQNMNTKQNYLVIYSSKN